MSSTSAATTSAPSLGNACALSVLGSRVMMRAVNSPEGSFKMARAKPPPCAPVAPTTAMIFFAMGILLRLIASARILALNELSDRTERLQGQRDRDPHDAGRGKIGRWNLVLSPTGEVPGCRAPSADAATEG